MKINCVICNEPFQKRTYNNNICSSECKRLYNNKMQLTLYYKRITKKSVIKKCCVVCNIDFVPNKKGETAKTCSLQCRKIYIKRWHQEKNAQVSKQKIISCIICSKEFKRFNSKRICCSIECSIAQEKRRKKNDNSFRLRHALRGHIRRAFKNNYKNKFRKDIIFYNEEDLRKHLENKFKPGMNCENYGIKGWHIDHIRPLVSFQFFDSYGNLNIDQVIECMSLDNLQPLWWDENLHKAGKHLLKLVS